MANDGASAEHKKKVGLVEIPDEALELAAVGRLEPRALELGGDALLLLPGADVDAHQVLRLGGNEEFKEQVRQFRVGAGNLLRIDTM